MMIKQHHMARSITSITQCVSVSEKEIRVTIQLETKKERQRKPTAVKYFPATNKAAARGCTERLVIAVLACAAGVFNKKSGI